MVRTAQLFMVDFVGIVETGTVGKNKIEKKGNKRIVVAAPSVVSAMDHVLYHYRVSYGDILQVIRQDEIELSDKLFKTSKNIVDEIDKFFKAT